MYPRLHRSFDGLSWTYSPFSANVLLVRKTYSAVGRTNRQGIISTAICLFASNTLGFIIKMCYYIDHSFYYSKCRAQPRHIQSVRKWDECMKAKANGHYCPDASPAKDLSGNVIVSGSSKQPGECPQCPPPTSEVSWGKALAMDLADMHH